MAKINWKNSFLILFVLGLISSLGAIMSYFFGGFTKKENTNDQNTTPAKNDNNFCHGTSFQTGWGVCLKCNQLYYLLKGGNCPAGDSHEFNKSPTFSGRASFRIPIREVPDDYSEKGWKWCQKCGSLSLSIMNGKCFDKGQHDYSASCKDPVSYYKTNSYHLCTKGNHGYGVNSSCKKCANICIGSQGVCQDGQKHEFLEDKHYQIPWDDS